MFRTLLTALFIFAVGFPVQAAYEFKGVETNPQAFDITAYGAVCDGVTDDSTAISNANDDADAANGYLYIPPTVEGCGVGTTIEYKVPIIGELSWENDRGDLPGSQSKLVPLMTDGSAVIECRDFSDGWEIKNIMVDSGKTRSDPVQNAIGLSIGDATNGGGTTQACRRGMMENVVVMGVETGIEVYGWINTLENVFVSDSSTCYVFRDANASYHQIKAEYCDWPLYHISGASTIYDGFHFEGDITTPVQINSCLGVVFDGFYFESGSAETSDIIRIGWGGGACRNFEMNGVYITGLDSTSTVFQTSILSNAKISGYVRIDDADDLFTGTHDGSNDAATLTDSTESWTVDELVGWTLVNTPDSSGCTVTSNTATTVTCTLENGVENNWDSGDAYVLRSGERATLIDTRNETGFVDLTDLLIRDESELASDGTDGITWTNEHEISVLSYGADRRGQIDSSQFFIDAARSLDEISQDDAESWGGVIHVPAGTYIAEGIPLNTPTGKPIIWRGQGIESTTVRLPDSASDHLFKSTTTDDLRGGGIEGMTIIGDAQNGTGASLAYDDIRTGVYNCIDFSSMSNDSLYNWKLEGNFIRNCKHGWHGPDQARSNVMSNNEWRYNEVAIYNVGDHPLFTGYNDIRANYIGLGGNWFDAHVNNVKFVDNYYGIKADQFERSIVDGVAFFKNKKVGIEVEGVDVFITNSPAITPDDGITADGISVSGSTLTITDSGGHTMEVGDRVIFNDTSGFSPAINNYLPAWQDIGSINTTNEQITITGHGFTSDAEGHAVSLKHSTSAPEIDSVDTSPTTVYYLIYVDANTIQLAASYDDAVAGSPTAVNFTSAGTGAISLVSELRVGAVTASTFTVVLPSTTTGTWNSDGTYSGNFASIHLLNDKVTISTNLFRESGDLGATGYADVYLDRVIQNQQQITITDNLVTGSSVSLPDYLRRFVMAANRGESRVMMANNHISEYDQVFARQHGRVERSQFSNNIMRPGPRCPGSGRDYVEFDNATIGNTIISGNNYFNTGSQSNCTGDYVFNFDAIDGIFVNNTIRYDESQWTAGVNISGVDAETVPAAMVNGTATGSTDTATLKSDNVVTSN